MAAKAKEAADRAKKAAEAAGLAAPVVTLPPPPITSPPILTGAGGGGSVGGPPPPPPPPPGMPPRAPPPPPPKPPGAVPPAPPSSTSTGTTGNGATGLGGGVDLEAIQQAMGGLKKASERKTPLQRSNTMPQPSNTDLMMAALKQKIGARRASLGTHKEDNEEDDDF